MHEFVEPDCRERNHQGLGNARIERRVVKQKRWWDPPSPVVSAAQLLLPRGVIAGPSEPLAASPRFWLTGLREGDKIQRGLNLRLSVRACAGEVPCLQLARLPLIPSS